MSLPLEFTFNQKNLDELLNHADTANIVITVSSITEEDGKREMYLGAQAYDSSKNVIEGLQVAVGCPSPPPWKNTFVGKIDHASVEHAPRFSVDAAKLRNSLSQNSFIFKKDKLVKVQLGAKLNSVAIENSKEFENKLESFIAISILDGEASEGTVRSVVKKVDELIAEAF
jgi:hypothetical protein